MVEVEAMKVTGYGSSPRAATVVVCGVLVLDFGKEVLGHEEVSDPSL